MQERQDFFSGEFAEQKRGDVQRGMIIPAFTFITLLFDDGIVIVNKFLVLQA
jgi:hypothetical protein